MSAPAVRGTAPAQRAWARSITHGAGHSGLVAALVRPLGGARQIRKAGAAIAIGYSRHPAHGSSRPRGVSGHFIRRQVGGVHRRRGRQTTALRAAHCWRRAAANHVRSSRSRVPSLVARLELDPLFFAGGTRRTAGKHLGDPGTWRRATARRQQRGRCRRQSDGWTACAVPAGESRHPAGDRANGRFQVRRGRRVQARHVLLVSALVAGRQMGCVPARRQHQVRRFRGARSWRRTAAVDA